MGKLQYSNLCLFQYEFELNENTFVACSSIECLPINYWLVNVHNSLFSLMPVVKTVVVRTVIIFEAVSSVCTCDCFLAVSDDLTVTALCECNTSLWSHPSGGFISFNGSWRVQGILAMSRSLGDYPLKNLNVVIPDPDILTFDLDKLQPEFMILASDGLWDAFSNEEAVRFVRERLDEPHFGAKSIVLQSFYRGCPDNITVMVVKFKSSSGSKTGE